MKISHSSDSPSKMRRLMDIVAEYEDEMNSLRAVASECEGRIRQLEKENAELREANLAQRQALDEYERNEHYLLGQLRHAEADAWGGAPPYPLHKEVNHYYPGSTQIRESGLAGAHFAAPVGEKHR